MFPTLQGLAAPETPYDLSQGFSGAASRICRGVIRLMDGLGFASLQEFPLKARRRADVIALNAAGEIVIFRAISCPWIAV